MCEIVQIVKIVQIVQIVQKIPPKFGATSLPERRSYLERIVIRLLCVSIVLFSLYFNTESYHVNPQVHLTTSPRIMQHSAGLEKMIQVCQQDSMTLNRNQKFSMG